jgi:hypothetical protein
MGRGESWEVTGVEAGGGLGQSSKQRTGKTGAKQRFYASYGSLSALGFKGLKTMEWVCCLRFVAGRGGSDYNPRLFFRQLYCLPGPIC